MRQRVNWACCGLGNQIQPPPTWPHLPILPKHFHHLGTEYSNIGAYKGAFSFKPPHDYSSVLWLACAVHLVFVHRHCTSALCIVSILLSRGAKLNVFPWPAIEATVTAQWSWKWQSGGEWESVCSVTIPNGKILSPSHWTNKNIYCCKLGLLPVWGHAWTSFSNPYR